MIYKSKQSYYELFDQAKISWKKTQKTNPKFDKELVKKKTEKINDILFKNIARLHAEYREASNPIIAILNHYQDYDTIICNT